ncbi:MAG: TatD family hydrolase [bacterium]|nr:TatD family hydrolase [bacterium]
MLIDTHAHLNFPDFEKDLDEVVNNALKNGVEKIICVSSNLEDSKKAIDIVRQHPGVVYAAVGIHPQNTNPENSQSIEEQIKILSELAREKEVVAIGECGLDFSPAPPGEEERTKEEQLFLFEKQIELAQKLSLPVIIHSRKVTDKTIEILSHYFSTLPSPPSSPPGVWHCYSGSKKGIEIVKNLDFYFGLDGNLTYDEGLQNIVRHIPLERILLETDSPFLTPIPYRGLRNTPVNVKIIAEFLAQLQGVSFEKVCQITSENAKKFYNKI